GTLAPGTAICARPLKYLEMAARSSARARVLAPGATICARPLEQVQVAVLGSSVAKIFSVLQSLRRKGRKEMAKASTNKSSCNVGCGRERNKGKNGAKDFSGQIEEPPRRGLHGKGTKTTASLRPTTACAASFFSWLCF